MEHEHRVAAHDAHSLGSQGVLSLGLHHLAADHKKLNNSFTVCGGAGGTTRADVAVPGAVDHAGLPVLCAARVSCCRRRHCVVCVADCLP